MSTATIDRIPRTAPRPSGLFSALRYEWAAARTLRSTWLLCGLLVVAQLGFAAIDSRAGTTPTAQFIKGLSLMTLITALFATALGVMSFGGDFRHRTIVPMALTVRSRTAIVAAKAVVVAGLGGAAALVAAGIDYAGVLVLGGGTPGTGALAPAAATVLYVVLAGLTGLAAAGLLRSAVAALAITAVWQLVLEVLVVQFLKLDPAAMPFLALRELAQGTPGAHAYQALPLIAITLAGLAATAVTLTRRDV